MSNPEMVVAYVRTNKVGSKCEFDLCTREEWDDMDEKEQDQFLLDQLFESGQVEYGIKEGYE